MPGITKAEPDSAAARRWPLVRDQSDPSVLARLLEKWMEEDEAEQRETFEFLRRALDEDRPPGYKLFP